MDEINTRNYIDVNEDYRISFDGNSYVLERKILVAKKDGNTEHKWQISGYYSDVEQCLYKVLSLTEIKPQDSVRSYYERFKEMYKYLYIAKFGEIIEKAKEVERNEI